jgi:hypothetical protein
MGMTRSVLALFMSLCFLLLSGGFAAGQEAKPVARWGFDESNGARTKDVITGIEDSVSGYYSYVPGVTGNALRFDGYTTSVTRSHKNAPPMAEAISVSAWVAANTYPWNWVPVVDFEDEQQGGYFLGIDAEGHVGMSVEAGDRWQSVTSEATIPLKKWAFVAGTYDPAHGLSVYINGSEAGHVAASGKLKAPTHAIDLLIGRIREPVLPYCYIHPKVSTWYSFDGLMDEVSIYDQGLRSEEVRSQFAQVQPPQREVLPWPVLPAGTPGTGPFGAYYATLKYQDTWDRLWRLGPFSDVVVRFDHAPIRLVFWHGLNYIPAWVTENGKWYTDEFLEDGYGGSDVYDAEPMSDKQTRYSRVNILESTPARAVVHWRYALADILYRGAHQDPLTGWFDWADEYYTVYPDGVAVRKQVLHHSDRVQPPKMWHEWQETIIVNGPGTRPEDNIQNGALTLANMAGQTATYSWLPRAPEALPNPPDANIQVVNLKSTWKPFQVAPQPASFTTYTGEDTRSTFEWWNHWPVGLIDSSGRCAVAPDRASSSSLSHIYWPEYSQGEDYVTKLLMDGLTDRLASELAGLGKSWLRPATVEVLGQGFESHGYDPAERAYIVVRNPGSSAGFTMKLKASEESPVVNPVLLVRNWDADGARVEMDGRIVPVGTLRVGTVRHLDGSDLVVFVQRQTTKPTEITVAIPSSERQAR